MENQPDRYAAATEHYEDGQYEAAAAWLQRWLADHPGDAEAYARLARTHAALNRNDEAWLALDKALSIDPTLPAVQRNRARLLLRQQKSDEALASAQSAFQADNDNSENQLVLAAAFSARGQDNAALPLLERVLRYDPTYAEALAQRALIHQRAGDLPEALQDLESALARKPHLVQLWQVAASLRYQLGDLPGTIRAVEQILAADPTNLGQLANLGELKRQIGDIDGAIDLLQRAAGQAPRDVRIWVNLGTVLQHANRFEAAKEAYTTALSLNPAQPEVENNLGVLASRESWTHALSHFHRAVLLKPDFAEAYNNLGAALQRQFRSDEAIAAYAEAVRLRPDHGDAQSNLADLLVDVGRIGAAVSAYESSLLGNKGGISPAGAVYLAILRYLQGEMSECRRLLSLAEPILHTAAGALRASRNYHIYLSRLISLQGGSPTESPPEERTPTLYVVGESHALCAHRQIIRYGGQLMRCSARWIRGCKQWHFARSDDSQYKVRLQTVFASIPEGSTVLIAIGEIDCRPDEGIIPAWLKSQADSLETMTERTVTGFIDAVKARSSRYGHKLVISAVPASNIDLAGIINGEYVPALLNHFNAVLRDRALHAGMDFLDVYALTNRGDGMADGRWHIDAHHLLPSAVAAAFEGYCIQS